MIYFNLNIRNPWWEDRFQNIWNKYFDTPWKHKYIEIQCMKVCELFRIEFDWTIRQDHAGVGIEFALLGYQIDFRFYDNRHWDYENKRWL